MGMDLGRASGGRAPLLVFGLILICVFLIFNWWSLSSQNLELFRQLEERGEHLKLGSIKIRECNHIKQELETELSSAKQILTDRNSAFDDAKNKCDKIKEERDHSIESNTRCNVELESLKKVRLSQDVLIESRRVEKGQLESELKDKKAEITRLLAELKDVQEKLSQKDTQLKEEVAAVPNKEESSPINHEVKNVGDVAAAAVNTVIEQNEEAENKEADNAIEDDREKEQERENARNTADVPKSS